MHLMALQYPRTDQRRLIAKGISSIHMLCSITKVQGEVRSRGSNRCHRKDETREEAFSFKHAIPSLINNPT